MSRPVGLLGTCFLLSVAFSGSIVVHGEERPPLVELLESCSEWTEASHNRERLRGIPIACQISDGPDPVPLVRGFASFMTKEKHETDSRREELSRRSQSGGIDSLRTVSIVTVLWLFRASTVLP